jgi:hypothetical protein
MFPFFPNKMKLINHHQTGPLVNLFKLFTNMANKILNIEHKNLMGGQ